ncbi:hypothetical protein [Cypionkella psychrotolerans]|uniref:hypothetical protein n=1 Tax=Cypionkella psychrotolerans TaxID=1678131 RepID=UPI000A7746E7|nr:hypothetical protein [Cypionkella psychrotolerans]
MYWSLPLAALVFLASPATPIAAVCLERSGEFGSNGVFDWCRTSGEIRSVVGGDNSTVARSPNPVLGGDSETGPIARYEIALHSDSGSVPSEGGLALLNTTLTHRVCSSFDLRQFITSGATVVFDLLLVTKPQNPLNFEDRKLVSSVTVATCEAL